MNKIDLSGRVAVVTGGAQGFGRAVTERFVASGAKVAIWDRDITLAEKTAKEIGDAVKVFACDVSELAPVEAARDATLKAFGQIDILVNNAGIAGANATTWDTTVDEWRKVMRINLDGPFICSKVVAPTMIKQKYGRIVNIASIAGKEGNPNAAHYSASKAGVIALTKSMGKELAGYDIAVNAVTPAAAKTAIFDQITQQHIDFMLSKIPRNRFVLVEELAAMVAWLSLSRQFVHHRRRVRPIRRSRDLLIVASDSPAGSRPDATGHPRCSARGGRLAERVSARASKNHRIRLPCGEPAGCDGTSSVFRARRPARGTRVGARQQESSHPTPAGRILQLASPSTCSASHFAVRSRRPSSRREPTNWTPIGKPSASISGTVTQG